MLSVPISGCQLRPPRGLVERDQFFPSAAHVLRRSILACAEAFVPLAKVDLCFVEPAGGEQALAERGPGFRDPPVVRRMDGDPDIERRSQMLFRRSERSAPRRVATRARIVLLAGDGRSKRAIAKELRVSTHTVVLWRRRFLAGGVENLLRDAPGRGRTATVTVGETAARLLTLAATPPSRGRWTVRRLAEAAGVSRASTHRILRASGQ